MARILFFVFLAFLVWLVVRMAGARRPHEPRRDAPSGGSAPPVAVSEPVTQCAWCGAHVPVGAALSLPDGRIYCSGVHREQARLAMANPDAGS